MTRPIAQVKTKWWGWIILLISHMPLAPQYRLKRFVLRHGVKFRFYNEPWIQASELGNQMDEYAYEVAKYIERDYKKYSKENKNDKNL